MRLPTPPHSTHFVGIGGVGMSALAEVLLRRGYLVSGSDLAESETTQRLRRLGAAVFAGHDARHVIPPTRLAILSTAVGPQNPERLEAMARSIPLAHRSELLALAMDLHPDGISLCGTHGKSTTTAMTALCLEAAGVDPTALVGAHVPVWNTNARIGSGRFFVAETDESDGSFANIHPRHALVTNIDSDHLDHFGTVDNIADAFHAFINGMRPGGWLALGVDCPRVAALRERIKHRDNLLTYALYPRAADVRARNIESTPNGTRFTIDWRGRAMGDVTLSIPGLHNVSNALGVLTLCRALECDWEPLIASMGRYGGISRRFQIRGEADNVLVVDDYAHHPTELMATLSAAKQRGRARVIAAFQPHRYSRTQLLHREFGPAFHQADTIIVTDVYAAGEAKIPGVSGQLIYDAVDAAGHPDVIYRPRQEDLLDELANLAQPGDLVITLGAGDLNKLADPLLERLALRQRVEATPATVAVVA